MKTITSLLTLAVLVSVRPLAHADSHTWNGAAITPNWSTPANWVGNNPPYVGEPAPVSIIFPAGAAQLANYCNIANLSVDTIQFTGSGYTIVSAAPGNAITLNKPGTALYCSGTANEINAPIVLAADNLYFAVGAGKDLHLSGVLSGAGSFMKLGRGDLYLEGFADNTFTKPTTVIGGTLHLNKGGGHLAFSGPLIIGDTNGPAFAGQTYDSTVQMEANQQMSSSTALRLNPNGFLELNGYNLAVGSLTMVGDSMAADIWGTGTLMLLGGVSVPTSPISGGSPAIDCSLSLGGGTRTFDVTPALYLNGMVSSGGGNPGILKTGKGFITFNYQGNYTGTTTIDGGAVYVAGSLPNSPVVVHSPGQLSGAGIAGTVTCQGGTFLPLGITGAGNMTSKGVTLDSSSTFGASLNSYQTPATPSFLTVTGAVNLGNCKFAGHLNTNATFNPGIGASFLLIQNDGNDPVNGTFAGLPEGAKFNFSGRQWQITYQGGTGNDVAVTMLSQQLPFSTDRIVVDPATKSVLIYGTCAPMVLGQPVINYGLEFSTDLVNWTYTANVDNNDGTLEWQDFAHYGLPNCFFRFVQQ